MSEKNPNEDHEKSNPSENLDNSSQQEYQKLLEEKIDKLIEQMSEMNDKHPYEDYKSFETSKRVPSYFKDLPVVSIFELLKTKME